jgi:myo-inositol-1(or 4)-monophosphatase
MSYPLTSQLDTALNAARRAGDFLRQGLGAVSADEVAFKGDIDIVTPFDLEAQNMVVETLRASFPDHGFLTEEDRDARVYGDSPWRWIIDPLDGTSNYASGSPHFCTSLALEFSGEIVLGVVYSPVLDESFYAVRGNGAFLNGRPISVSSTRQLIHSVPATGFPYDNRDTLQKCLRLLAKITPVTRSTRVLGAAALDLCYVACGRMDAYWDVELFPWDMSAGGLIVKEAGGKVSDLRGEPFSHLGKDIIASNGFLHPEILEILGTAKNSR